MERLKNLLPRQLGNGWDTCKFHEQLHVIENIMLFGAHVHVHTGPSEHNHIENAKKPAKWTQMRRQTFDLQLANRVVDKYILSHAMALMFPEVYNNDDEPVPTDQSMDIVTKLGYHASKYSIDVILQASGEVEASLNLKGELQKPECTKMFDNDLLATIVNHFIEEIEGDILRDGITIHGCTEVIRENTTFRAHPSFLNNGPWYDYVMVAWEQNLEDDETNSVRDQLEEHIFNKDTNTITSSTLCPAELVTFVWINENKIYAVIHSCHEQNSRNSVITYCWCREYVNETHGEVQVQNELINIRDTSHDNTEGLKRLLRVVDANTIEKHTLCVPFHDKSKFVIQIADQTKWANCFM